MNSMKAHKETGPKRPVVVIGGRGHTKATSFTPKRLEMYEITRQYREQGIVWLSPTRGKVWTSVVASWLSLSWPMNQFRSPLIATEGMEVAEAYNRLVKTSMNKTQLRQAFARDYADAFADAPFILTTEEDNVLPGDVVPRLLTAIFKCPDCAAEVGGKDWKCKNGHKGYDGISGLYFVKTDPPVPMAFGTPNGHKRNMDFKPRSVAKAVKNGEIMEVNGIAMGCALFRKALFRKVSQPWFKTTPEGTQDLYFCKKAKIEARARFGVHCGLRVAHFQPGTNELY